jgi:hypothetical protein
MAKYVDNTSLKEVINLYNKLNIADKGDWCPSYLQRQEKKYQLGKITKEQFELSKQFIQNKVKNIEALQEKYTNFTEDERRKFNIEFERIKNDLYENIIKIVNGRINSFKIRKNYPVEDVEDITQDALICVLNYINRFDESRGTSAFSYVTELATNSIVLSLKKLNERSARFVNGLEFFENINTVDNPYDGNSGLSKFIE